MIVRLACFAMGTRFELLVAGEEEVGIRGAGEEAIGEIEEWDRRLSLFRPDSLVSLINRTAHERPVRLDRGSFELLAAARNVWRASEGALDITMGGLMTKWGFHAAEGAGEAPDEAVWGMDGVILDDQALTVSFARPGLKIDLGAVAKGHAIDSALGVLRERGVRTALLHAGTSSVGTIGAPDDQPEGWHIALGQPGAGAPLVLLRDASLSVSGQHGRTVAHEGEELGHIIDPRTGSPARGGGGTLSCVIGATADAGRITEAWSTALLVLDRRPEGMPRNLVSVLRSADGSWRVEGEDAGRYL